MNTSNKQNRRLVRLFLLCAFIPLVLYVACDRHATVIGSTTEPPIYVQNARIRLCIPRLVSVTSAIVK